MFKNVAPGELARLQRKATHPRIHHKLDPMGEKNNTLSWVDRKGGVHLGTVRRGGEYDKNILHKNPKILIKSLLEKKNLIGKV